MAELKGTQVAASIVPFTDLDTYATHDAEYGKGGFRSVSTIEDRDAIPFERKTEGMIVRVTANGLNYEWKNNAWVEWLPKGNIVIDTTLNATSTNPVQNKVITTRVQTIENRIALLSEYTHNIPIITVDTVWNATSDNPASSKAIESTISPIRTTANSARSIADAAIPKSYIDDTMPENPVATRVPSTKLLGTVSAVANTAKSTADSAMTAANSAGSVANAAIPKSWIDSGIDGTETSNDSVPGTGAIVAYIKKNNTGLSTQISNTNSRVTNLESWKSTIGTKGAANGVASLDSGGKIPASQLPAGYDNVDMLQSFVTTNPSSNMQIGQKFYNTTTKKIFTATSATTGVETAVEGGDKIYINITENKSYRWTGAKMVAVGDGSGVALGTTSSTAFRGDYGNTLYTNFGSGTNLTGTQAARDFFHNMSLFNSLANTSILKNLVVQPEANFVRLQNDIVYLIGEVNTGDGYDIPAATTTKAGVMTADMYKTLQEIELATFPLNLALAGGGTWEMGSSTKPVVSITATRKGSDVTSSCSIVVQPQPSLAGSLSSDKRTWTASTNISNVYNIKVSATLNTQSITKSVIYYFKYKKYYGTSSNATLTNAQILALGGSTWADSRSMGATNFDCTGGKYVYYVIPHELGTPEFWVGGLKNTDISVGNITVTNASGGSVRYLIMRLANIQTGVLSVEFK